jgi:AcrR family transcriptional regulator
VTNSRSALLEAAVEVFTERGYEAATVAEIADRAGVTTGALYAHFHGKLDLLLQSLGLKSVEHFAQGSLSAASLGRRGGAAGVFAQRMSRRPRRETILLLDVIVAARRDPKLAAVLRRLLAAKIDEFTAATRQGTAAGLISPVLGPDDLARFMTMAAFGNMVLAAIDENPPSQNAFAVLMGHVLTGGGADGAAPGCGPLSEVAAAAGAVRASRTGFEASVRTASDAGYSLRRIADEAGVSHEQIRRIVAGRPGVESGE